MFTISYNMNEDLTKSVMLSEQAHQELNRACRAEFGTTRIRYSDAIEQFCEQVLNKDE